MLGQTRPASNRVLWQNDPMDEREGSSLRVAPGVTLPEAALGWTFSRGGGPGGQNVNKVNTRATLTVELAALAEAMPPWSVDRLRATAGQRLANNPERLVITAADSRSQLANRESCLLKLRELLVAALHRPKRRRATKPSRGAIERRLQSKEKASRRKQERSRDWRPSGE